MTVLEAQKAGGVPEVALPPRVNSFLSKAQVDVIVQLYR
jgi:hypothetical protein